MSVMRQPKRRGGLYLDALGDPGRTGGQPVYALALVWLGQSDPEVEEMFRGVRVALGLRIEYEFHARQVTKEQWRQHMPQQFFALLREQGLRAEVWCAGIRKQRSALPLEFLTANTWFTSSSVAHCWECHAPMWRASRSHDR